MIAKRRHLLLCLVMVVAVGLRLWRLNDRSIWFDEASSWLTAQLSLSELWASLTQSTHVPLYYPLLRIWMEVFGESPNVVRGYSVLCGLLTISGCGWLGQFVLGGCSTEATKTVAVKTQVSTQRAVLFSRLFQRRSRAETNLNMCGCSLEARRLGLLCMSLCALSAFQVQASVEARMYSLGTLLCVVSTGATIRLLKRPESGQAWCLLCVVTIASLYTHHLLAVTAAVQAGFLVARCFARSCPKKDRIADVRLRKFCVVTIGCVLIAWIPALILWWKQVSRVSRGFWIVPMDRWSLPRVCLEFVVAPPPSLWWNYRYWGIPLTALFLCILGRVWMRGGVVRRLLVCQAVVPMIVIALVSLKTPLWEGRYFRFAHISLLMCVAIFLSDLRSKRLRVGFGGLIFATFLTGGFVFWSLRDIPERQAVRGAMGWLQEQDVDSQRPLIVTSPMNFVIAKYYAPMFGRSRDKIWLYTGEERNPHAAVHLVRQSDWWPDDELPDDELPDDAWILHKNHEMPSHTIPKSPVFQSDTWIDEWSIRVSLTSSQLSQ